MYLKILWVLSKNMIDMQSLGSNIFIFIVQPSLMMLIESIAQAQCCILKATSQI